MNSAKRKILVLYIFKRSRIKPMLTFLSIHYFSWVVEFQKFETLYKLFRLSSMYPSLCLKKSIICRFYATFESLALNLWMNTYPCKATFLACQIIFVLYLSPLTSAKYSKQTFTSAVLLDKNQKINLVLEWQSKWHLLVGLWHKKLTL